MRKHELDFPELALIAGTRAMIGLGLGLLVGPKLRDEHRKAAGWTLLIVGLVSTIPLLAHLLKHDEPSDSEEVGREELQRHDALSR